MGRDDELGLLSGFLDAGSRAWRGPAADGTGDGHGTPEQGPAEAIAASLTGVSRHRRLSRRRGVCGGHCVPAGRHVRSPATDVRPASIRHNRGHLRRTERAAMPKRTSHARIPHRPDLDLGRGSSGYVHCPCGMFVRRFRIRRRGTAAGTPAGRNPATRKVSSSPGNTTAPTGPVQISCARNSIVPGLPGCLGTTIRGENHGTI